MSLLCSSQSTWDTFHLLKERGAEPPQHRKSEWRSSERRWQAVFPVGPVSSSHGGTYRCYGSSNSTPNVWSQSSDPLHLGVTGEVADTLLQFFPGPQITDVNLVPDKALKVLGISDTGLLGTEQQGGDLGRDMWVVDVCVLWVTMTILPRCVQGAPRQPGSSGTKAASTTHPHP